MNRSYLFLLPEFAISSSIIYSYILKLSQISQGQSFTTVTGLDTMVIETVSAVFSIILIALITIIIGVKKNNASRTIRNLLIWLVAAVAITLLIGYSKGSIAFDPAFLYILLGSTFIKLWQYIKNRNDTPGSVRTILAYVFIYGGSYAIATLLELHIFDYYNFSEIGLRPTLDITQSFIRTDAITAIIFYFTIGFIIPIIMTMRQKKKSQLGSVETFSVTN